VGDVVGPVVEMGVTADEVDGTSGSASPVHASENAKTTTTQNAVENLC
jgi:hypothetical protein